MRYLIDITWSLSRPYSLSLSHTKQYVALTCMKPRVLLNVTELFEPSVTIGTFVRFFPRMDTDMLDELVITTERLQTLLALVRFDFRSTGEFSGVHLHSGFMHKYL